MSSTSFANKLFNRLDNGLLYEGEYKQVDINKVEDSDLIENNILSVCVDQNNIYIYYIQNS